VLKHLVGMLPKTGFCGGGFIDPKSLGSVFGYSETIRLPTLTVSRQAVDVVPMLALHSSLHYGAIGIFEEICADER
jgi:hypothetical protein